MFAPTVTAVTLNPKNGPLGVITAPMEIDGTGVTLDGSALGATANGLVFSANGNVIIGLTIHGFGGVQITLNSNINTVRDCYIGTNADGSSGVGGGVGIDLNGSTSLIQNNVISGLKGNSAVYILNGNNNTIQNNFVGTNKAGTQKIGNSGTGITLGNGANNNTIQNNVISGNGHTSNTASFSGIDIGGLGTNANHIQSNFIGTDINGASAIPNIGYGIDIFGGAANNFIGTASGILSNPDPQSSPIADGANIISGNSIDGVCIFNSDSNVTKQNQIQGNLIGTDIAGVNALPNGGNGVSLLDGATDNIVGGDTPDDGNLISGNKLAGILIGLELTQASGTPATHNTVSANYIGTDADGHLVKALANQNGIYINAGTNNIIGADQQSSSVSSAGFANMPVDESNLIAGNTLDGVLVASGSGNRISLNRIFGNARMGIELGKGIFAPANEGTFNPNHFQNYPLLTSVTDSGGQTTITGSLTPQGDQTSYWVEFYANSKLSADGNLSEGEWFLGAASFSVAANGTVPIYFTCTTPAMQSNLPASNYTHVSGVPQADATIAADHLITAIAVDGNGNTSEFSPCRDILRNAVGENSVSTKSKAARGEVSITRIFQPNTILGDKPPLTIAQAAKYCGASDFNWFQTYSSTTPGVKYDLWKLNPDGAPDDFADYLHVGPYNGIDPVMNAPPYQVRLTGPKSSRASRTTTGPTDGLPYYYNLTSLAGSEANRESFEGPALQFGLDPKHMLIFYDAPNFPAYLGSFTEDFVTRLAGVPANGAQGTPITWVGLNTIFTWHSNGENATDTVYQSSAKSPPLVAGGVFGVQYADPLPSPYADDQLVITAPAYATPQGTFSVTVQVNDSGGNLDTSYNGAISLNLSKAPAGSALAGLISAPVLNGLATFTNLSLNVAGNYTLAAGCADGPSAIADIVVAPVTHFSVVANTTGTTAGNQVAYTITALDALNHRATNYQGTIQLSSSDLQANFAEGSSVQFAPSDQGSVQVTVTLATAGAQKITAVDSTAPSTKSTSGAVKVSAGLVHQLGIASASGLSAVIGAPYSIIMIAQDQYGNRVNNYAGTISFGTTTGTATLPASYKFTPTDAGAHTFAITPTSLGSLTLTAGDGSSNGSTSLTIVSTAARLTVALASSAPVVAGVPFDIVVKALDAAGHLDVNFQDNLHFASTDGLSIDRAFTSGTGMQTFTVTLSKTGTLAITASDTTAGRDKIKGISGGIAVKAVATQLVLTPVSSSPPMVGIRYAMRITAEDSLGNVASSYHGTIHFSVTTGAATVPASLAMSTAMSSFSITPQALGTLGIDANDGTLDGTASLQAVSAATHLVLKNVPTKIVAGQAFNITVASLTAAGGFASPFQDVLHFANTLDASGLPADAAFSGASGQQQYSITLPAAGMQTITLTDLSSSNVKAVSLKVNVAPANNGITPTPGVSGPSVGVPGQPLDFTVSATENGAPPTAIYTYRIDWLGNGQLISTVNGPGSGIMVRHVYTANGNFTTKVTATDAAGDSGTQGSLPIAITTTALEFDPVTNDTTALAIGCPASGGTVLITPTSADGTTLAVKLNGAALVLPAQPFSHVYVFGQSGNDTIQEVAATIAGNPTLVSVPAWLFGGAGANTLSAAASSADNILIGGVGKNTITGGTGRDILIGGGGAATLTAGGGGAVLIAGSTPYDVPTSANLNTMLALAAEWSRTDVSYTQRVQDLTTGGGLNGLFLLDPGAITSDTVANHLYGGVGEDWYLVSISAKKFDQITGYADDEIVNLE